MAFFEVLQNPMEECLEMMAGLDRIGPPDGGFMKEALSWLRATLAVVIESATQAW